MTFMDFLYIINVGCIAFSGWLAFTCFVKGNDIGGWMNVFASSLNLAIVANHFL